MVSIMMSDRRFRIEEKELSALVKKILIEEKASGHSLNVIYCTDRHILDLNKRFMKKSEPTDVIAFDMRDRSNPDFIGEVYVNLQQAKRQAGEFGAVYKQEVRRLTIHGVLHLLGYDDKDRTERERMWSRQESYL